jgi:hypothetical protein
MMDLRREEKEEKGQFSKFKEYKLWALPDDESGQG